NNKKSYYNYEYRKLMLEETKLVDEIIPENDWSQKKNDIILHGIDIMVMGSDWEGKFDYLNEFCQVIYLPRTEGISSTQIKEDIGNV
ncbi:glycerol-3-phosphate cytidylyltransferase, partial [Bacillus spizizenii]|nr:glycerol-3-phosphate cytidylyltransferase [Bacillus spizizenii]